MKIAMKPKYLLLLAALGLASCSQEDMPGRPDGESKILFRTSLPELTSRAEVVTKDNLPYFYVSAFDVDDPGMVTGGVMQPLFDNGKVDASEKKSTYTSSYCCWPDPGKESDLVRFFSFYPGPDDIEGARLVNNSTATTVDYKLTGFSVASDIADQLDFITAYTTGTMDDNLVSGIVLPFVHQLSRVEVKASGANKSCDIEIAGVRIGGTGVGCTFDFKPADGGGEWLGSPSRGIVEYVYRTGDKIVSCGKNNPVGLEAAVSIMGCKNARGEDNCAMLIPSEYAKWDFANDRRNTNNRQYISVLIRVTDATPNAGQKPANKQRYPYTDKTEGDDAPDIPVVYMAVDKATGEVAARLYRNESGYFTDNKCTEAYNLGDTEEIKEFGWAALPIEGSWAPGYVYTYTLDFTYGVGLHEPTVETSSPGAGDPILTDMVGVNYSVEKWKVGGQSKEPVPGS